MTGLREPSRDAEREAEWDRVRAECDSDPVFLWGVIDEVRALWKAALEREGNLASAVADVMQKATQYGATEDGDTAAYLVPKGCMHRLIGVAQSNGAHVPVSFRDAAAAEPQPDPEPMNRDPADVAWESLAEAPEWFDRAGADDE